MLAKEVCQNFLKKTLTIIHSKRVNALFEITRSLTNNAKLTLTSLGRPKEGAVQVKHKISKAVSSTLARGSL